jgi:hypothetical protein
MSINSQWVTVEGGITNTFPLSINRTAYWTALRRGECYYQDMTNRTKRGVLSYEPAPNPSPNFFVKRFVESVGDVGSQLDAAFFYGRWWRISLTTPTKLEYSDLGKDKADFTNKKFVDFIEDSSDPIRLLATDGDGKIFVIKSGCGYTLEGANQDPSVWRKNAPEFSIGTVHEGPSFTNGILNGSIMLVWDGNGEHGKRHYQWTGRGTGAELSEDIRELTEADQLTTTSAINWSQQLVLVGSVCYDMNARRIFYYSGQPTASYISKPFFDSMYRMQTVSRMSFITDGKAGSFDAILEYGQAPEDLQKTKAFKVRIKDSAKNRFRHVWNIDLPCLCRVWRIKIDNLVGCSISQIDADISINRNPDFEEAV